VVGAGTCLDWEDPFLESAAALEGFDGFVFGEAEGVVVAGVLAIEFGDVAFQGGERAVTGDAADLAGELEGAERDRHVDLVGFEGFFAAAIAPEGAGAGPVFALATAESGVDEFEGDACDAGRICGVAGAINLVGLVGADELGDAGLIHLGGDEAAVAPEFVER
jgi:hypothetical protein